MSSWTSNTVDANGITLHYWRTGGDKPPLVLCHGITDNGLCWTRAARALEARFDVIMLDAHGHVAEGSGCNLFLVRDGVLITAPITGDILEGITRRSIILFAKDLGIPVEERVIDRSELYIADEAFFCGTGMQIAPIASIDGRPVHDGQVGPITAQLREVFFDTVRGKNPKYAHFLTKVRIPVAAGAD